MKIASLALHSTHCGAREQDIPTRENFCFSKTLTNFCSPFCQAQLELAGLYGKIFPGNY